MTIMDKGHCGWDLGLGYTNVLFQIWGDGSFNECLAMQARGLEFNLQSPSKKPDRVICVYNPITGEAEIGGLLDIPNEPAYFK